MVWDSATIQRPVVPLLQPNKRKLGVIARVSNPVPPNYSL